MNSGQWFKFKWIFLCRIFLCTISLARFCFHISSYMFLAPTGALHFSIGATATQLLICDSAQCVTRVTLDCKHSISVTLSKRRNSTQLMQLTQLTQLPKVNATQHKSCSCSFTIRSTPMSPDVFLLLCGKWIEAGHRNVSCGIYFYEYISHLDCYLTFMVAPPVKSAKYYIFNTNRIPPQMPRTTSVHMSKKQEFNQIKIR